MTNATRSFSHYLAPALLALGAALAAGNWYLQPERGTSWAITLLLIACMALALLLVPRFGRDAARESAARSIRSAVVFAGLLLVVSLGVKLATALGVMNDGDLTRRATMVIIGAFLVSTGNTMPKRLTPLAALECSPATVQAFQRFAGWTWVLTGVAVMIAWLALPLDPANTVSTVALVSGMIVTATRIVQLRLTRSSRHDRIVVRP